MFELLIVVIALALVFDFINGFHDSANSIATIVSTRVLTPFQAVVWAAFIKVCDELEGIPPYQVNKFQKIAALTPAKITTSVIDSGFTVLATVSATLKSAIQYATTLKKAAHTTA